MRDAIVLSGGGSKGAFEVGAVRYLYAQGVRPEIICGVSVGAINAAKLAEGEGPDPTQGLAGLESIWASMRMNSDMYSEEAWLHHPDMHPSARDFFTGRSSSLSLARSHDPAPFWALLNPLLSAGVGLAWTVDDMAALLRSLQLLANARALYNLNPLVPRLGSEIDPAKIDAWASAGRHLRLGTVGLESGELRWITERGDVIDINGNPVLSLVRGSCTNEQSAVDAIRREISDAQELLSTAAPGAKSQIRARIQEWQKQLVALEQAFEECVHQLGPAQMVATRTTIAEGVLASASIPGFFPPVILGDETYVDGGVREVLPAREAVRLGAERIFCINSGPTGLARTPHSFFSARILDIVSRALIEIMVNEVELGDALPPHRRPAHVQPNPVNPHRPPNVFPNQPGQPDVIAVDPTVDVYSILTIDPGLIRINRDYGYMRAADAFNMLDATNWRLSDDITNMRVEAWTFENAVAGRTDPRQPALPAPPADPSLQAQVDRSKQALDGLLQERRRLGGPLPDGIFDWVQNPELHQ